jgi:hypothetical protein
MRAGKRATVTVMTTMRRKMRMSSKTRRRREEEDNDRSKPRWLTVRFAYNIACHNVFLQCDAKWGQRNDHHILAGLRTK